MAQGDDTEMMLPVYSFSLIATTQGDRPGEFSRLLDSLESQTYRSFTLIVVDQSDGSDIKNCLVGRNINAEVIPSGRISLSAARNIGLQKARGDIVVFPDDDCWFPDDALEKMDSFFYDNGECTALCGCAYDPHKKRALSAVAGKISQVQTIREETSFTFPISITIACKVGAFEPFLFDEDFGVGARWHAGEETDFVLNVLKAGGTMFYVPDIRVYHPYKESVAREFLERSYNYGIGFGALVEKSVAERGQMEVLAEYRKTLFRSFGGCLRYLFEAKRDIYVARIKGILVGRRMYRESIRTAAKPTVDEVSTG